MPTLPSLPPSRTSRHVSSMSGCVQVFGRRHDEPFHALLRPASKKRQGTKSRDVCGGGAAGAVGIWPRVRACRGWIVRFAAIGLRPSVVGYVGVNERSGRGATGLVAGALVNPR